MFTLEFGYFKTILGQTTFTRLNNDIKSFDNQFIIIFPA